MKSMNGQHPGRVTNVVVTHGALNPEPGTANRAAILIGLSLGSGILVLLLTCANVTTLLLARGMARRHEIAVRLSVGASMPRLVRQLVTETLVLAFIAAIASIAVAYYLPRPICQMLTPFPIGAAFAPDWRVISYTLGAALVATALAGVSPALESVKFGLADVLQRSGSTNGPPST